MALQTFKLQSFPSISATPSAISCSSLPASSLTPFSCSNTCWKVREPFIDCSLILSPSHNPLAKPLISCRRQLQRHVVRMAPQEQRKTQRSPLQFPVEWENPKPGKRINIFPKFSPFKTPLPPPMPIDPPLPDEDEEEQEEQQPQKEENPEEDNEDDDDEPKPEEV